MRCPADWTNTRRGVPALPTFQRLFVSWSKFVELTGRNPVNPGGAAGRQPSQADPALGRQQTGRDTR